MRWTLLVLALLGSGCVTDAPPAPSDGVPQDHDPWARMRDACPRVLLEAAGNVEGRHRWNVTFVNGTFPIEDVRIVTRDADHSETYNASLIDLSAHEGPVRYVGERDVLRVGDRFELLASPVWIQLVHNGTNVGGTWRCL